MRAVIVLISLVGVILGARLGWQAGLLTGLGVLGGGVGPAIGSGSTLLLAGGGALISGVLGGAACLLLARVLARFAGPQH